MFFLRSPKDLVISLGAATALALRGRRKRSLSTSGAVAAFCVGFIRLYSGNRGILLIAFYQLGSWATKYGADRKGRMDAGAASGDGERGSQQVLGCSLIATVFAACHLVLCGEERPVGFALYPLESVLACAIAAHDATCLGDSLASELGMLSSSPPRLITTFRRVPPGTNGAVSLIGTAWSAAGGAAIGLVWWLTDAYLSGVAPRGAAPAYVSFGAACGLLGSTLDSILGATCQSSYFDEKDGLVYSDPEEISDDAKHICGMNLLTNVQVNVVSIALTCFVAGIFFCQVFFP